MRHEHTYHRFAEYDREQIGINVDRGYRPYAMTCFHAHQDAEKTLKDALSIFGYGDLKHHGLYKYAQDLARVAGVDKREGSYRMILRYCSELDPYYTDARYPSDSDFAFDEQAATQAVLAANAIRQWVDSLILPDGTPYADSFSLRRRSGSRIAGTRRIRFFRDTRRWHPRYIKR